MTANMEHERQPIGWRAKVFASVLALAVGFGLCEIAARVLYPAPPEPAREPQLLFQSDPQVGFTHVPGQAGFLDDGLATINAKGLRGDLPETPKPLGSLRVLAVGDSTTFGWGVNDRDTYCALLQRMLIDRDPSRPVSVVNAGVSAYDLRQTAGLLRRLAPELTPDVVLVGFFWNDLPYETISPDGMPQVAPASPMLVHSAGSGPRRFRLANQPSRINRLLRSSRVIYLLRKAWLSAVAPTGPAGNQVRWEMALLEGRTSKAIDDAWQDVAKTLAEIRALGEVGGYEVGVVIIPIRAQVEGHYPHAAYQMRVRAIAESLGLFVIDPLPEFLSQPDRASLFIPYDRMHFSAAGNACIARAAFDALQRRPRVTALH